jgi:phosphoribosyl-ATP pyrophosphohydrolase
MRSINLGDLEVLERLSQTLASRRGGDVDASYSSRLIADPKLAARKLGEEANEVIIAALCEGDEELAKEAADLIYHMMALLEARQISLGDVLRELAAREGISGLEEKAARELS